MTHLTSHFDYSLTKKRLVMISKTTTPLRSKLKLGILLLGTAFLIPACSNVEVGETVPEVEKEDSEVKKQKVNNTIAKKVT